MNAPSSDKSVIFTADDFGLADGLNGAVVLAHRRGLLSCASLMAAGPRTQAALSLAGGLPGLCLGVHLTLIQGRAVLPPQAVPHLVDSRGFFPNNPVAAGWRYFWQTRLLPEIRRELAAQIEVVLKAGLPVWHLNGHLNLHLHPRWRSKSSCSSFTRVRTSCPRLFLRLSWSRLIRGGWPAGDRAGTVGPPCIILAKSLKAWDSTCTGSDNFICMLPYQKD